LKRPLDGGNANASSRSSNNDNDNDNESGTENKRQKVESSTAATNSPAGTESGKNSNSNSNNNNNEKKNDNGKIDATATANKGINDNANTSTSTSTVNKSSSSSNTTNNNNSTNSNMLMSREHQQLQQQQHYFSPYPHSLPPSMSDPRTAAYAPYPPYLMHMYGYPPSGGHMMSPVRHGHIPMLNNPTYYPHDMNMRMMGGMSMMGVGVGGQQAMHAGTTGGVGGVGGQGEKKGGGQQQGSSDDRSGNNIPPRGQNVRRCERILPPITLKVWSAEQMANTEIPDFPHLVNFPAHLHRYRTLSEVEKDRRRCVMCGETRLCSTSSSNQSREAFSRSKQKLAQSKSSSGTTSADEPNETVHIIPKQNKGLCTKCDVAVWVIKETRIEIKWCKGCKNFRPWAAFGDKGLATKCLRCRERQREKYATQKEEKYRKSTKTASAQASEKREKAKDDKGAKEISKPSKKGGNDQGNKSPGKGPDFSSSENHGISCLIAATTQVTRDV